MSAAAAATAPLRHSRPSPLNPNAATTATTARPSSVNTRTHLANLDRLLVRPPPLPLPLWPKKTAPADERRDEVDDDRSGRGGLLNALNLSTLLPFTRKPAAEEMSPRSLAHMQRLLTLSPRPSPRGSIAAEWRRYHGEDAWEGLVDPLDQNLRREVLRYGDFVQAAYAAFHSMPASPSHGHGHGQHRTLVLPDRSYRPTRSLFATSSLSIPPWAQRQSAASRWLTQRTSFVGYVAVCDNEREVRRMGRRDVVIVLRGTATCPEWAENLRTGLVPVSDDDDDQHAPKVAKGFLSLYKTAGDQVPSLSDAIVEEVRRLVEVYKGEELSITVVGHSLGASLALLAADELSACLAADAESTCTAADGHRPPPISVVSFGGPKTGNRAFADRLQQERGVNVLRVVNAGDVVTRVPGLAIARPTAVAEGYAHAGGAELRLDSRDSPCLRPDAGPACCHDLEAYLHLLDGFAGSDRPFRADASRSVAGLLAFQRSNVKRAYVERARVLGFEPAMANGSGDGQYGYLASPT
uniref:Uncharacterized protein n=1 Tax=Avena sativa TaxID=4498 RepID=A0ACD5TIC9_AVESA